jgi:hypothetical protein
MTIVGFAVSVKFTLIVMFKVITKVVALFVGLNQQADLLLHFCRCINNLYIYGAS